jgi:hypothetical protein
MEARHKQQLGRLFSKNTQGAGRDFVVDDSFTVLAYEGIKKSRQESKERRGRTPISFERLRLASLTAKALASNNNV